MLSRTGGKVLAKGPVIYVLISLFFVLRCIETVIRVWLPCTKRGTHARIPQRKAQNNMADVSARARTFAHIARMGK